MLSRRGRKRKAPARLLEAPTATPATRSRRGRSGDSNAEAASANASTGCSAPSVGGHQGVTGVQGAPAVTSAGADVVQGEMTASASGSEQPQSVAATEVSELQQQMLVMQQQMQSMHDVVLTLSTNSCATPTLPPTSGEGCDDSRPVNQPTRGGESSMVCHPSGMNSHASVPLGSLLVEKPMLIFDVSQQQQPFQYREQAQKRITNIHQWTDAFLVYMAVYLECHDSDVASILKYMQIIRSIASTNQSMFMVYDRDFRKLRAINNMSWDVIHQELYLSLSLRAGRPIAFQPKFAESQRRQPFRNGLCFAFGATGNCKKNGCQYKHACPTCGGNHPKFRCAVTKNLGGSTYQHRSS